MYCSKCGKELSTDAKFCQHCGTSVLSRNKAATKPQANFQEIREMTRLKKAMIAGGGILCLLIVFAVIIGTAKPVEEKSIEEHLLGEWIAENDNGETSIVFEQEGDKYIGEWIVYNYNSKEWEELNFTIKEIDNHLMTILTDDGEIEFVPFAVSKDTLIFANVEYKNESKNVPIPVSEYAYIKEGVIWPVTYGCYMGMSKDEVEKVVAPLEIKEYPGDSVYCMLTERTYGQVKLVFDFDETYGLARISYYLDDDHYDSKENVIIYLSGLYGEYEKIDHTDNGIYWYVWNVGNLEIRLSDHIESKSLSLWYELDTDTEWYLEFRRNNK